MVPIVSIVGNSNSGKTTLIERLIPILKNRGYKVGAIKHDAHEFQMDHEGKDTYKMSAAGADGVVISSKNKLAMIKPVDRESNLNEVAQWLLNDMDIIITEGYKAYDKPKIEIIRYSEMRTDPRNNLIAIVDNSTDKFFCELPLCYGDLPVFPFNDSMLIADFIEERFLTGRQA